MNNEFISKIQKPFFEKQLIQDNALKEAEPVFDSGHNEIKQWPELKTTIINECLNLIKEWINKLNSWIKIFQEELNSNKVRELNYELGRLQKMNSNTWRHPNVIFIRMQIFRLRIIKFIFFIIGLVHYSLSGLRNKLK